MVSAEGGQITATAADGTRFTLVVPPQALLSEVEIKMTPVAQVGLFPLSGDLVAAVQLEPEGLLLWEPASLTIEPAVPEILARKTYVQSDSIGGITASEITTLDPFYRPE